jgi:hypothetical protein
VHGAAAPPPASPATVVWDYQVDVRTDRLQVSAQFAPMTDETIGVDEDAAPFVRDVEYSPVGGATWTAAEQPEKASWRSPCARGCRVKYTYLLRQAAETLHDPETAIASAGLIAAPPATWLLRPDRARGGLFRFHFAGVSADGFATSIRRESPLDFGTFVAPAETLEDSSFVAFGTFDDARFHEGTLKAEVVSSVGLEPLGAADVKQWVSTAVDAITSYYGRPFTDRVLVIVMPGSPGSPTRGVTLGDAGPAVLIRAAPGLTAAGTRDDWVMTHELLHVSLPSLGREHAWLSEGIATYVEPIVRARAGLVTPEKFWGDLAEGLPQGEPAAGDEGLEHTHTWGRTYWGGALFCLVADLAIRQLSHDKLSFDDALRAIVASGADVETHWSIEQFIAAGDRAWGCRVGLGYEFSCKLSEIYRDLALAPGKVDLVSLWQRLGVRVEAGKVTFDDRAPLADIRRAITAAPAPPAPPAP